MVAPEPLTVEEREQIAARQQETARLIRIMAISNVAALLILAALVIAAVVYARSSHDTFCAFKTNIEKQVASSQRYLDMTPRERIKEFGPQLGTIPLKRVMLSMPSSSSTFAASSRCGCGEIQRPA